MTPKTVNFPVSGTLFQGDTFDAYTFTGIQIDAVNIDLDDYPTIEMEVRRSKKTGTVVKTLTKGSGLTQASATNLTIDAFTVNFTPGTYYYDIQFTHTDGSIYTYFDGVITVTQDVTQ